MSLHDEKKIKLKKKVSKTPQEPGVYFFVGEKGKILYIGKTTNLRSRVQSYFRGADSRGQWIEIMVEKAKDVKFQLTDSAFDALILESNLIRKFKPEYNTLGKDDKSFAYFAITEEDFPRVLIFRATDIDFEKLEAGGLKLKAVYGPYAAKYHMEIALKIIRKIFPFHLLNQKTEKGCLDYQIGLCPGPYDGAISKADYKKNIRNIMMVLEGKRNGLIRRLTKEMDDAEKKNEFEKATDLRNKVFALRHINDVALMTKDFNSEKTPNAKYDMRDMRIEAYDISNIAGTSAVGSMVVFSGNQPDKSQYRKFRIKTVEGSDDVGMMKEILTRRFHNDWPMPDLVLLDGGAGHLNMAEKLLREQLGLDVVIAAVAKGPKRKNQELRMINGKMKSEIRKNLEDKNLLKYIMDEAHRFAIAYHRKTRDTNVLK
jgi:excinuclease ABC subunit C